MNGRDGLRVGVLAVGAALLQACGEARGAAEAEGRARRVYAEASWRVEWKASLTSGAVRSPTPYRLTADGRRVYVVDATGGTLTALRGRDGKVLWSTRGADSSSRLATPHDVAVVRSGHVVVADMDRRVLVVFDSSGAHRRTVPLAPPVYSMCALGDSVLMLTWSAQQPVWLLDLVAGGVSRADLPWPELRGAMPDRTIGSLQANEAGDACAYARESADGFAVWRGGAFGAPHAFVERPAASTSGSRSRTTALSAALVGERVYVLFGGSSDARRRVIDVYDARTGRYERSVRAPTELIALAYHGGRFYGIAPRANGAREIIAFSEDRT